MQYFDFANFLDKILSLSPDISDINFSVGRPPQVTLRGELIPVRMKGLNLLSPYQTEIIALSIIKGKRELFRHLLKEGSVDLPYSITGKSRFRVNIFSQRGTYAIVMRVIQANIPTLENLGIPIQLASILDEKNGIILVTGPTGSGKSSTLAALINQINQEKAYHVITIEDPIEFMHAHNKSTINQREIGVDTKDFSTALRAALRQAPNVILVGEMRDVETTSIALEAAETGHLVFSTLHTVDASKTIDRIIGIFPEHEEQQIRTRFAAAFRYIISQRLIPARDGKRRVPAVEILKSTERTRQYIESGTKEGLTLHDAMEDGILEGMQTFDSHIMQLIKDKVITAEDGLNYSTNRNNLLLRLQGEGLDPKSSTASGFTADIK